MQGRTQVRAMRRRRGDDDLRRSAYGTQLVRGAARKDKDAEAEQKQQEQKTPQVQAPIGPEDESFRFPGEGDGAYPVYNAPDEIVPRGRVEPTWQNSDDVPIWNGPEIEPEFNLSNAASAETQDSSVKSFNAAAARASAAASSNPPAFAPVPESKRQRAAAAAPAPVDTATAPARSASRRVERAPNTTAKRDTVSANPAPENKAPAPSRQRAAAPAAGTAAGGAVSARSEEEEIAASAARVGGKLAAVFAEEAAAREERRKAAAEAARKANEWHVVRGDDFVEGWSTRGERDSITARLKRAQKHLQERGLSVPDGDIGARTRENTIRTWQKGAGVGAGIGAALNAKSARTGGGIKFDKRHILALALLFVLSLLIELFVFNYSYFFFDNERYAQRNVPLPQVASVQRPGVVISSANPRLVLNNINQHVRSVCLAVDYGARSLVHGSLLFTDEAQRFTPMLATKFALVANDTLHARADTASDGMGEGSLGDDTGSYNRVCLQMLPEGAVQNIIVAFEPQDLGQELLITSVELNAQPELHCSLVRTLLTFALLSLVYGLLFSGIRQQKVVVDGPWYQGLNRGILLLQIALAAVIFYHLSPQQAVDSGHAQPALGVVPYSTPSRSLLLELPTTVNEFLLSDAYTQQLHAWVHGSMALSIAPDPRLAQMHDVYDYSERAQHPEVPYLWDRAYFAGKYYSAESLAPLLTIYLPIYALTGKVPCAALAVFIATLYALLALYLLSNRLMRVLTLRCNPLLFTLSKLSFVGCSFVLTLQLGFWSTHLDALLAIALLALALALSLSIARFIPGHYPGDDNYLRYLHAQGRTLQMESPLVQKYHQLVQACKDYVFEQPWWCALELILSALSCALLFGAQPWLSPYALLLSVMLLVLLWRADESGTSKAVATLSYLLPLMVGVSGVLWYNQARFGSPFSFGSDFVLSYGNAHAQGLGLFSNLAQWHHTLFAVLGADWSLSASFPYVYPAGILPEPGAGAAADTAAAAEAGAAGLLSEPGGFSLVLPQLGLLVLPFIWASLLVFLMVRRLRQMMRLQSQIKEALESGRKVKTPLQSAAQMALYQGITWSFVGSLVLSLPLSLLQASSSPWQISALAGHSTMLALISFIAMMMLSFADVKGERSDAASHRAIAFICCVLLCLCTMVLCFFLNWSANTLFAEVNPDFYLQMREIFAPLSFTQNLR